MRGIELDPLAQACSRTHNYHKYIFALQELGDFHQERRRLALLLLNSFSTRRNDFKNSNRSRQLAELYVISWNKSRVDKKYEIL